MEFDEVFRVNNLIPLINQQAMPYDQSIFSMDIFGLSIPLIYKTYISSVSILPWLPLVFFDDYIYGIRFLYALYFFLSFSAMFVLLARYGYFEALLITILAATSPLFMPEARIGFADSMHIFFMCISFLLIGAFFKSEKKKASFIFWASFFLCLCVNIRFYFIWVLSAAVITGVILYFDRLKTLFGSFRYVFAAAAGAILGLINFIVYNIATGFATFKPIFLKIFFSSEYNKHPIDYKQSLPFISEAEAKINALSSFFGGYAYVYLSVLAAMTLCYLFMGYKMIKDKNTAELKPYLFAVICFWLILFMILISPNTTRPGHYIYLVPFFELSLFSLILLASKVFNSKSLKNGGLAFICLLACFSFYISGSETSKVLRTKGTGYFSPAIFSLNSFISENKIDSDDIVFFEWGSYPQLYFINKGNFRINTRVFQLIDKKNKQERFAALDSFFRSGDAAGRDSIYFPLYTAESDFNSNSPGLASDILEFISANDGRAVKVKTFCETNGKPVIDLYRLDDVPEFAGRLKPFCPDFSETEMANAENSMIDFTGYVRAGCVKNVYISENNSGGKWAGKYSRFLLRRNTQGSLLITAYFPDMKKYENNRIAFTVLVNGESMQTNTIRSGGFRVFDIKLKNEPPSLLDIGVLCDSRIIAENDKRELAVFLVKMELK